MKSPVIVFALALAGCASQIPPRNAMDPATSLAAAESAFAAHSVREDMRVAFMANFADDGVFVRQGWTIANAQLAGEKAPPIVLDWRPVYTEVARSGELGLSTGPWKITSKARPDDPPRFGQFVSVWRRSPEGRWQVAVDLGTSHPQSALWDAGLEAVNLPERVGAADSIARAEERLAAAMRERGAREAYREAAVSNIRFYRLGMPPLVGRDALGTAPMPDAALTWTIERSETSSSADFGYARGRYAAAGAPEKTLGYFLRVWRVEDGAWRLVLDVLNPAS